MTDRQMGATGRAARRRASERRSWAIGGHTFWADDRTLVGGDPYRSLRLTPRGAAFVRAVLADERAAASRSEFSLLARLARANLITRPTHTGCTTPDVTLVVPARSTAAEVQRVLDSAPGVAAIVIDDASPVPLDGLLRHTSTLRVIRNATAGGPAAARNAGARAATTSWVAFADADLVAKAGWIGELLAYADGAVALAPRIVGANAPGLAARFERAVCALDMGTEPGFVTPSGRLPYVPSAALVIRRDAFLEVNGFDESLRVGEDVDLVWRLADVGVYYEPSVVVAHRPRPSLLAALRRRAAYGRSAGELAERHPRLMHHGSYPIAAALPWILAMAGKSRFALGASLVHLALAPRSLGNMPRRAAVRASATGQWRTSVALSRSITRPLMPASAALCALSSQFRRRAVLVGAVAAVLHRRNAEGAAWQLVDDAAYSMGVWQSAIARGDYSFLIPRLRIGRRDD